MKRALSSHKALRRRGEGWCLTAVRGEEQLSTQRCAQDGQGKPPCNRSENATALTGGPRYNAGPTLGCAGGLTTSPPAGSSMVKDKDELLHIAATDREQLRTQTAEVGTALDVCVTLPLPPVREATVMTTSSSIPLQTGLELGSQGPRTERLLFGWLVTRAVISAGKCAVCAHTSTYPPLLACPDGWESSVGSCTLQGMAEPGSAQQEHLDPQGYTEELWGWGRKGCGSLLGRGEGCRTSLPRTPGHVLNSLLSASCNSWEAELLALRRAIGSLKNLENLFP